MFLETLIEPVAHHQENSVHGRASRQSERAKRSTAREQERVSEEIV
jgi:hypothetical protein